MRRLAQVAALLLSALPSVGCGSGSSYCPPAAFVTKHLYFSQDGNGNGLFELDLTTGIATLVGAGNTGTTSSTIGLTETTNIAQLLGSTYADIAQISANGTGATVLPASAEAEGLAMNITTGILYGDINNSFFTIDPVTGAQLLTLAVPPGDCEGLAADPVNNRVYGVGPDSQNLFVYNVATDTWSTVGSTGRDWLDAGMAFDRFSNVLYATDATTNSLYRINPATGATTLVGPLGTGAGGGLAFVGFTTP